MTPYVLGRGHDLTLITAGDTDPYIAWCAALAVCGHATSPQDARELLDALGLTPQPRNPARSPVSGRARPRPGAHRKRAKTR